jgi:hypothetical protein
MDHGFTWTFFPFGRLLENLGEGCPFQIRELWRLACDRVPLSYLRMVDRGASLVYLFWGGYRARFRFGFSVMS